MGRRELPDIPTNCHFDNFSVACAFYDLPLYDTSDIDNDGLPGRVREWDLSRTL